MVVFPVFPVLSGPQLGSDSDYHGREGAGGLHCLHWGGQATLLWLGGQTYTASVSDGGREGAGDGKDATC